MFETREAKEKGYDIKEVKFDSKRRIKTVSMKVLGHESIYGLRLIDRDGIKVVDIEWAKHSSNKK